MKHIGFRGKGRCTVKGGVQTDECRGEEYTGSNIRSGCARCIFVQELLLIPVLFFPGTRHLCPRPQTSTTGGGGYTTPLMTDD